MLDLSRAEFLCRIVGGADLEGRAVYLLDAREVGPHFAPPGVDGYTSVTLDLELEHVLRERRRWVGRGWAAILCGESIESHGGSVERRACAVALHELAHHCETSNAKFATLPREELPVWAEPIVRPLASVTSLGREAERGRSLPPWDEHHLPFIRAAAHICHRAERVGHWFDPDEIVFAGETYGLSPPGLYMSVLRDELHKRIHEPISLILESEPPAEAAALFHSDRVNFYASPAGAVVLAARRSVATSSRKELSLA